ncbi:MAG: MoaD/ThiS family protein [Caldilineales bacterium]|nr:MoaD/ThiS family protein [Caldilineales bacterium]MCX7853360.1 MoaD/ThiS family protein [Caldilineales bacterium]
MSIIVRLAGSLRPNDDHEREIVLTQARTVGEAVGQLDLPQTMGLVMLVNGRLAHWQTELQDGDVLQLLPVIGGGASVRGHV